MEERGKRKWNYVEIEKTENYTTIQTMNRFKTIEQFHVLMCDLINQQKVIYWLYEKINQTKLNM